MGLNHDALMSLGFKVFIYFGWITLGVVYTLPGPTLIALACNVSTNSLKNMGLVLTISAVGVIAGILFIGSIIKRVNKYVVLFGLAVLLTILTSILSIMDTLVSLVVVSWFYGLTIGAMLKGLTMLESSQILQQMDHISNDIWYATGAFVALLFSKPFLTEIQDKQKGHNFTINFTTNPHRLCSADKTLFQGAYWLSTLPTGFLVIGFGILIACKGLQPTNFSTTGNQGNMNHGKIKSWKMILIQVFILFFMLFHNGNKSMFTFLLFSYAMLGPAKSFTTGKALFLNCMFWLSYLIGIAVLSILVKRIKRTEKHLLLYVVKSGGCLISAVVLLLVNEIYGVESSVIIYGLSSGGLITFVDTIIQKQNIMADKPIYEYKLLTTAVSMAIFPYISLSLAYRYGNPGMTFVILVTSLALFAVCALLVFLSFNLQRELISLQYQHLQEIQEDNNGEKLHNEIKRLLGSATDPESGYQTTDDEVVFDKRRIKKK